MMKQNVYRLIKTCQLFCDKHDFVDSLVVSVCISEAIRRLKILSTAVEIYKIRDDTRSYSKTYVCRTSFGEIDIVSHLIRTRFPSANKKTKIRKAYFFRNWMSDYTLDTNFDDSADSRLFRVFKRRGVDAFLGRLAVTYSPNKLKIVDDLRFALCTAV